MPAVVVRRDIPPLPGGGDYTFGRMKSDVAAAFGMDGDIDKEAMVGRFIQGAMDDLNRRQVWTFNIVTSPDIPTIAGESTYSLVTVAPDFWKTYNARKTSDIDYQISTVRQKAFDTIFVSQKNITGFPYVMVVKNTYRDATVQLFPAPDSVYTFQIRYYKLIGKPSNDESFIDLPRPYQLVPMYRALHRMALFNNQVRLALEYEKEWEKGYNEMKRSDEDQGDEDLRFINIEEILSRGVNWSQPGIRPRAYDFF